MAPPVYSVGQVLGAADCNNWFVPLPAYKTSTQSVTSSTVLVNDTQLFVSVAANAVYDVRIVMIYDGAVSTGTAAGIKITQTVPASATYAMGSVGLLNTSGVPSDDITAGSTAIGVEGSGSLGAGTTCTLMQEGLLTTSASSGTFQVQWAQNVSSVTATRVFAGSKLILFRVG